MLYWQPQIKIASGLKIETKPWCQHARRQPWQKGFELLIPLFLKRRMPSQPARVITPIYIKRPFDLQAQILVFFCSARTVASFPSFPSGQLCRKVVFAWQAAATRGCVFKHF